MRGLAASRISRKDDVLVAGAGPAGSMAALVLARAGVRVRLLDRATFPRDKLCGDTLNPGALSIIERVVGASSGAEGPEGRPLEGMMVTGPGQASVTATYPKGLHGLAITRRELDTWLLNAAIAAGAQFESGVAVRDPIVEGDVVCGVRVAPCPVRSTDRPRLVMRARVVIGAEGRHARLAFRLGLSRFAASPRRWAVGAYFDGVHGLSDRGEMHIRPDGYVGIAPLPGGIANVCVVQELDRLRAPGSGQRAGADGSGLPGPGARSPKPEAVITAAIAADAALAARFAGARRTSNPITLGPLGIESRAAGCPGLLLAGDAAGFIDPMTGDGLRFALRGGELAAEAALAELASGAPAFADLAEARAAEFAGKWRLNRALRLLVGSPRAVGLAAVLTSYWSAPVQHLVGLAGDVPLALRHRAHLGRAPGNAT